MLIPSQLIKDGIVLTSLSRRVNANSQRVVEGQPHYPKLIKKGEC